MSIKYKCIPTGNEFISIPSILEEDASISGVTLLHMGYKGLIEVNGNNEIPFLKPFILLDGAEIKLSEIVWKKLDYWIPCFECRAAALDIEGIILAPVGERGFIYRLKVTNNSDSVKDISLGLRGYWHESRHSINESKRIDAKKLVYRSNWNNSIVFDLRSSVNILSFAPIHDNDMNVDFDFGSESSESVRFDISRKMTLAAQGGECIGDFYWGFGFEEVSAATSAKEMMRKGFNFELAATEKWLTSRLRVTGDLAIDRILNTNLFFNFFFASGITMDTEEFVLVTSRSPRYYVSAAYWDRDSLLWSFPAILLVDPNYAGEMLEYVFNKQIRNIGIHSRYIDGTILEPGFELDELCAPVIALEKYIKHTGNYSIVKDRNFAAGISRILKILESKRHQEIELYETFLQPTDDIIIHPYLTYDNVLVWKVFKSLSIIYTEAGENERAGILLCKALKVEKAIWEHCTTDYNNHKVFSWSVDLKGRFNVYDEPPGSLQLLPYYGFCSKENEVYLNTLDVIRSPEYNYSFSNCNISEIGCEHAPHPWILSLANSLLCGRMEHCRDILLKADMDNGIACESIDENTGDCATGAAFATCAGFLAYAIYKAFGAS